MLKRIHAVLESASPQYFIEERVEGCEELQVIRAGNDLRIYCRLVLGIPRVNKEYNVLYALYVDPHEYRSAVLQRLDDAAKDLLTEATSLDDVTDVEAYLEEMHAFYAEDIQERIDRAC